MSSCTLTLSLKDGDRPLHAGDELEGEVEVRLSRPGRCDGLRVELRCHAIGEGNDHEATLTALPLFVGEWAKAETLRYPFRLTIPPAPPPYKGELMTVSHLIRATAEIPLAIDPKVDHPLTLVPSPEWHSKAAKKPPVIEPFRGLLRGLLVVSFLLAFMVLYYKSPTQGLLFMPLGAIFFIPSARNRISAWRISTPTVAIPRRIHPGQTVPMVIELDHFGAPLKAVSATLICTERVVSGGGNDASVYERIHHQETVALTPSNKQTCFEGAAVLPDRPLWSFEGGSTSVRWMLRVHLECAGWPDWSMSWPLSMDPPEAPALAAPPARPPRL
jgi:hypothetical protein